MVSLCCFKISFLFLATVLIFFIAGLLSNAPRARRSLGAYRIPWRPAFSSHLISPVLGSCSLRVPPGLSADDGQPGSYQLARWVSTEKRASSDRCMLARIRHLRFRAHVSSAVNVAQQQKGTMPRMTVGSVRPAARFDRMSACACH